MVLHLIACLDPFCTKQKHFILLYLHPEHCTVIKRYETERVFCSCGPFVASETVCGRTHNERKVHTRAAAHNTQTMTVKCFNYSAAHYPSRGLDVIVVKRGPFLSRCFFSSLSAHSLEMSHCRDVGYYIDFLDICINCSDLFDSRHLSNHSFLSSRHPLCSFSLLTCF